MANKTKVLDKELTEISLRFLRLDEKREFDAWTKTMYSEIVFPGSLEK